MKVKLILFAIISVAILFLLFSPLKSELSISVPEISKITGFIPFFSSEEESNYFSFYINSSSQILQGMNIELANSEAFVKGKVVNLRIDESSVENERVELDLKDFTGKIYFVDRFIGLEGKTKSLVINNLTFKSEKEIKVVGRIFSDEFSVNRIVKDSLTLKNLYGRIFKVSAPEASQTLLNSTLEIKGFVGRISYNGKFYLLRGIALNINSETFSWRG